MKAFVAALLGIVLGMGLASGCRLEGSWKNRRLTGTCEGACDRYLQCKRSGEPAAKVACVSECREVFQDEESLRAFESLECRDVIEYVEGESGTGPGTMVGGENEATSR